MPRVMILAACAGLGVLPGKSGGWGPGEPPVDVIRIQQIFDLIEQADHSCEFPPSLSEEFDRLLAGSADVKVWVATHFEKFSTQRQRVVVATMFALSRKGHIIPEFIPLLSGVVHSPSHDAIIFGLHCLYIYPLPNLREILLDKLRAPTPSTGADAGMIVAFDVYLTLFGVDDIDPIATLFLADENSLKFRADAATRLLKHAPRSRFRPEAVRVIVEFFKQGLSDRNALLCSEILWTVAANHMADVASDLAPFAANLTKSSEKGVRTAARAFLAWRQAHEAVSNP